MPTQLEMLVEEMIAVAGGGSVEKLRQMVYAYAPKGKQDAEQFRNFLRRLRLACEAAEGAAAETYAMAMREDKT